MSNTPLVHFLIAVQGTYLQKIKYVLRGTQQLSITEIGSPDTGLASQTQTLDYLTISFVIVFFEVIQQFATVVDKAY